MDLVRELSKGAWRFDPAQNAHALRDALWRGSVLDLNVETLKQTHHEVNSKFLHRELRRYSINSRRASNVEQACPSKEFRWLLSTLCRRAVYEHAGQVVGHLTMVFDETTERDLEGN